MMIFFLQVSMLTSFASSGSPTANVINADMQNVQAHPIETLEPPFNALHIGEDLKYDVLPEHERLAIWDELYRATNTPLY
jgi:hypothetical protein